MKKMRQLEVSKNKIAIQMDNLDVTDSMYEKKYDDLQKRVLVVKMEVPLRRLFYFPRVWSPKEKGRLISP